MIQGDDNGHVGRHYEVSPVASYGASAVTRTSDRGRVATVPERPGEGAVKTERYLCVYCISPQFSCLLRRFLKLDGLTEEGKCDKV